MRAAPSRFRSQDEVGACQDIKQNDATAGWGCKNLGHASSVAPTLNVPREHLRQACVLLELLLAPIRSR
jgi:hypothetical protein